MPSGPKILAAITCVTVVMLAGLFALSDEWTNCHIGNWASGYLGVRDFPPGVVVSGGPEVKTIDFRRVEGIAEVCVVRMPYYAEPGFTRSMVDRGFQLGGPRVCWRNAEGQVIVVGRSKDMPLMWKQIDMGDPPRWYTTGDKECAETEKALLTCRDEVCEFSQ
jgi:hypothetical protein